MKRGRTITTIKKKERLRKIITLKQIKGEEKVDEEQINQPRQIKNSRWKTKI